jgi:hypothetical protein
MNKEINNMSTFIANRIMAAANVSLSNGQTKYRVYFVNTTIYAAYQADVNTILETTYTTQYPDGYGECIVSV